MTCVRCTFVIEVNAPYREIPKGGALCIPCVTSLKYKKGTHKRYGRGNGVCTDETILTSRAWRNGNYI
jgi:hypothetical protein